MPEKEPIAGMYLIEPHGTLAIKGEKTKMLTKRPYRKYANEPVYLLEDEFALGIVKVSRPRRADPEMVKATREEHLVSDKEARKWWGWRGKTDLWIYDIEVLERFDPPREFIQEPGIQKWVREVRFKEAGRYDPSGSSLSSTEAVYCDPEALGLLGSIMDDVVGILPAPPFVVDIKEVFKVVGGSLDGVCPNCREIMKHSLQGIQRTDDDLNSLVATEVLMALKDEGYEVILDA